MTEVKPSLTNPLDAPPEKSLEPVHQAIKQVTVGGGLRRYRSWLFQAYILGSILVFAVLAFLVSVSKVTSFDVNITRSLQEDLPKWAGSILDGVSWFGFTPQSIIILVVIALAFYFLGLRWEAVMSVLAGIGSFLIDNLIKTAVHRPRPTADLVSVINELGSYSFPSGHVMFYVAFFGFLAFLAFTLLKAGWLRTLLIAFSAVLVVLVGPSRVYMGQHWASDVIAAYLLGFLVLWGVIYLYREGKVRYSRQQPVAPGREEGPQPVPITGEKKIP